MIIYLMLTIEKIKKKNFLQLIELYNKSLKY